jgi:hypothetical protein
MRITRIGVDPGYLEQVIQRMRPGGKDYPYTYVSDGNPAILTAPRERQKYIQQSRIGTLTLALYDLPKPSPKPIKSVKSATKPGKK